MWFFLERFGKVGDELKEYIKVGSKLSVVSAYFTIYAYKELGKELSKIDNMRFIFTELTFTKEDKEVSRQYYIDSYELYLRRSESSGLRLFDKL